MIVLAARWSVKYFFTPNSMIFRIQLTEKRTEGEQHRQLRSVMRFTLAQKESFKVICFSNKRKKRLHYDQVLF